MTPPEEVLLDLAEALLAEEPDICQTYEALKPLLAEDAFVALGETLGLCPVHLCDDEICRDDRDDCAAGRPRLPLMDVNSANPLEAAIARDRRRRFVL